MNIFPISGRTYWISEEKQSDIRSARCRPLLVRPKIQKGSPIQSNLNSPNASVLAVAAPFPTEARARNWGADLPLCTLWCVAKGFLRGGKSNGRDLHLWKWSVLQKNRFFGGKYGKLGDYTVAIYGIGIAKSEFSIPFSNYSEIQVQGNESPIVKLIRTWQPQHRKRNNRGRKKTSVQKCDHSCATRPFPNSSKLCGATWDCSLWNRYSTLIHFAHDTIHSLKVTNSHDSISNNRFRMQQATL
jgi:hypothetical protein